MAEKIEDIEVTEEGGGGKLKLIIIAVVVLALIGGGAWFFLAGGDKEAEETEEEVIPEKQAAIYFAVEKPLVVNFSDQSKDAARYLQIKLKVMARDQAVIDAFQLHTPAVQHKLLILFFGQNYDDLNTTVGTKALQAQTLLTINEILKAEKTEGEIEAVYFTSLIMQ